jgi:hypothetical protein
VAQLKQEAGLDDRSCTWHLSSSSSSNVGADWSSMAVSLGHARPLLPFCCPVMDDDNWTGDLHLRSASCPFCLPSCPLQSSGTAGCVCRDALLCGVEWASWQCYAAVACCDMHVCDTLDMRLVASWLAYSLLFQQAAVSGLCSTCWSSVCLQHSASFQASSSE